MPENYQTLHDSEAHTALREASQLAVQYLGRKEQQGIVQRIDAAWEFVLETPSEANTAMARELRDYVRGRTEAVTHELRVG